MGLAGGGWSGAAAAAGAALRCTAAGEELFAQLGQAVDNRRLACVCVCMNAYAFACGRKYARGDVYIVGMIWKISRFMYQDFAADF